jgi:hypothetical protein
VSVCRSKVDNAVDAAGAAWGLGFIGYKDNEAGKVGMLPAVLPMQLAGICIGKLARKSITAGQAGGTSSCQSYGVHRQHDMFLSDSASFQAGSWCSLEGRSW